LFDPTGTIEAPPGVERIRWSPIASVGSWDDAIRLSASIVGTSVKPSATAQHDFFTRQGEKLLAPLLYAASQGRREMRDLMDWINLQDLTEPLKILSEVDSRDADSASSETASILASPDEQRGGVFSSVANALLPYRTAAALEAAREPNFDADSFVSATNHSWDTIYIPPATDDVEVAAPIVVGFLDAIRRATFRAHAQSRLERPVLFALDEVTNIAPIPSLPTLVSQAGGQGLNLLCCFQDLSQAHARWGDAARGFVSLFGVMIVLPGIKNAETLEAISVLMGDFDRYSYPSTVRQRLFPVDEISAGIANHVFVVFGSKSYDFKHLAKCFDSAPWWHIIHDNVPCPPSPYPSTSA
jgi:type IV secretory pathway TraG/TraD family ATPase VirD4